MKTSSLTRWLTATGLALALAACGGGTDSPTGSGATPAGPTGATGSAESVTGTITGFGSVIVDGVTYDDRSATVKAETDASQPSSATTADLKLGMQVEVTTDDQGRAASVVIRSEVHGRVTAKAADGFTVAGQTVKVSTDPAAPTVWEGVAGLDGLAVNDFVEVHGRRDAAGAIVATRVERKDPSSAVSIRVRGLMAGLDTTAKTFTIGGLTVSYADAQRILPAGVVLANGQPVAVWTNVPLAGNVLQARSVVVKRVPWAGGERLRIGGLIRDLDFAAKTFRIDSLPVDASSATFEKGTAADLANGRPVRVRGTFVDGRVKASEVRFVRDQGDATVELTGTVTDFASSASFKVRGVPVGASGASVVFRNGTAANLGNGVLVKIEGRVDGDVVKPASVVFVTSDDGPGRWLVGPVSGYDAATGRFRLMNLDSRLADTTTFRNADGSPATRSDFGDGDVVQARGSFAAGVFTATEIVFRNGPTLVIDGIEGGATEVDLAAGRFRLNGTVVQVGPSTSVEGSLTNLRNGTRVEVYGTIVGGVLVASKVEVKTPDGDELARVRGTVGDYVSAADFRVAGQKVDASAASVEPAGRTTADLANGRFVEVRGPVVDGVLKATRLTFK